MAKTKLIITILCFFFLLNLIRAETVIATTKITYADTILAKVISEIFGYPQILLERDNLSNETISKLRELNVTEIIIIGGPAVVSFDVERELVQLGYDVIRIWGVERFETSALVAKYFWDSSEEAVLITEELANERANFRVVSLVREALEYAIDNKIPILITTPGNLEKNVLEALISLGVKKVKIFTISGNLGTIPEELDNLNISYEIVKDRLVKKCNVLRIGVPSDALWNLTQDVLIYGRCIEIVPLDYNVSLEELRNQNISIVIFNLSEALRFRERFTYREMIKKRLEAIEKLSKIIKEKVYEILSDVALRVGNVSEEYKRCYLQVISRIRDNKEEAYKEVLDCLSKINEYRWKSNIFVQDFKKQIIKSVKEEVIKTYKEIIENLTLVEELNVSEERIDKWMPDPLQIRERLLELIRFRIINRTRGDRLCIQVITCACSPFGKCLEFPTPCDVPPFWKVVPCAEINKTEGKVTTIWSRR